MLVDQQALVSSFFGEFQSQMQRQRRDPAAALCAKQRDDLPTDSRTSLFLLRGFRSCQSIQYTLMLHRLDQVFGGARAHGSDNSVRLGMGRDSKAVHIWIFGAQSRRDPERFLGIFVVVDEANAGAGRVEST